MARLDIEREPLSEHLLDRRISYLTRQVNLVLDYQEAILERIDKMATEKRKLISISDLKPMVDTLTFRLILLGIFLLLNVSLKDAISFVKF